MTDHIIRHLGLQGAVSHYTAGEQDREAVPFLAALPGLSGDRIAGCDVLIYQASADPHRDDPLGGWMTTAQLTQRDALVFQTARAMGLPVACDLAGGYQRDAEGGIRPVLTIHDNTMAAALGALGGIAGVEPRPGCPYPVARPSRRSRVQVEGVRPLRPDPRPACPGSGG